ncbi:hypothetical protein IQ07DRAFT_9192 [Pyrenochaeta sp. DS3sAY3a]|nr:hypothetical protein IQ07DRAFT_9192 [Pyrenochaeta sp. DS3sAY3a]
MYVGTFKLYTLYVIPSTFSPGNNIVSVDFSPEPVQPTSTPYIRNTYTQTHALDIRDFTAGIHCAELWPAWLAASPRLQRNQEKSRVHCVCVCCSAKSKSSKVHIPERGAGVNKKKNLVSSD